MSASPRRLQCVAWNSKNEQRCARFQSDNNPHGFCYYHWNRNQTKGQRLQTVHGQVFEPPEVLTNAEVVKLPTGREMAGRCQATSKVAGGEYPSHYGGQCKLPAVPGHATCVRHLDSNQDRVQIVQQVLEEVGLRAVLEVASIMEHSPSEKRRLEASEIILDRTLPKKQAIDLRQENLEKRDLDEEIFQLTEGLGITGTGVEPEDEDPEQRIRRLTAEAEAQGYDVEIVEEAS